MPITFEVKKKIMVDGKEYASLADVPAEIRPAIVKALTLMPEAGKAKTTFHVNGETFTSLDDVPAPLRALVRGVGALVARQVDAAPSAPRETARPSAAPLRPEPIVSPTTIVIAVILAAALFFLARLVF